MSFEQRLAKAQADKEAFAKAVDSIAPRSDELSLPDKVSGAGAFLPFLNKNHGITSTVLSKLGSGKLRAVDVLDSVANGMHPSYQASPEAMAHAQAVRSLAENIGGKNTTIEIVDTNNPIHREILSRLEQQKPGAFAKSRAVYDDATGKILLNQDITASNLVHE